MDWDNGAMATGSLTVRGLQMRGQQGPDTWKQASADVEWI